MAGEAYKLEWNRKQASGITPHMPTKSRKEAVGRVSQHNKMVAALGKFWKALMALLVAGGPERSGWLELGMVESKDGPHRVIFIRGRRDIADGWTAPTLILDATLDMQMVRPWWPQAEQVADIAIEAPFQRITQVVDVSFSKRRLLASDAATPDDTRRTAHNLRNLHAIIAAVGRRHAPGGALVVVQQEIEDALPALGRLPPNVVTGHHNAVAGRDEWRDVAAQVVVGRTMPPPADTEKLAEALTGAATNRLPSSGNWYPRAIVRRHLTDGSTLEAEADQHPDPIAEAVRWQICEGQLIQIIGRCRGVNRTADNPVDVLVMTDVPLPLPVNATIRASDIDPTPDALMLAAGGIAYSNSTDAAAAYPQIWATANAAKLAMHRRWVSFPYKDLLYGNDTHLAAWAYQRAGKGQRPATCTVDPSLVPDPAATIAAALGPLAWCRPAAPPAEPVAEPAPAPAPDFLAGLRSETPIGVGIVDEFLTLPGGWAFTNVIMPAAPLRWAA